MTQHVSLGARHVSLKVGFLRNCAAGRGKKPFGLRNLNVVELVSDP